MSDYRVEQITQAILSNQSKGGLYDIRVYMGPSRQFGQEFGDYIRNAFRKAAPVIMRVATTLFKSSSKSLKTGTQSVTHLNRPLRPHSVRLLNTVARHSAK